MTNDMNQMPKEMLSVARGLLLEGLKDFRKFVKSGKTGAWHWSKNGAFLGAYVTQKGCVPEDFGKQMKNLNARMRYHAGK